MSEEQIANPDCDPHGAVCPHCGAPLSYEPIIGFEGCRIGWMPFPVPCQCEGAQAERAELRRLKELREAEELEADFDRNFRTRAEMYLAPSSLRERFKACTFDTYKATGGAQVMAVEMATGYVRDFERLCREGTGLYIYSRQNGTGKTHLALAVAHALWEAGIRRRIVKTSAEILGDIRGTYGRGTASEIDVTSLYKQAELIVIDDLGKENMTGWAAAVYFEILDARYSALKPTIITSNYRPDELVQRMASSDHASAIASRLSGNMTMITMDGIADYRRRANLRVVGGDA